MYASRGQRESICVIVWMYVFVCVCVCVLACESLCFILVSRQKFEAGLQLFWHTA